MTESKPWIGRYGGVLALLVALVIGGGFLLIWKADGNSGAPSRATMTEPPPAAAVRPEVAQRTQPIIAKFGFGGHLHGIATYLKRAAEADEIERQQVQALRQLRDEFPASLESAMLGDGMDAYLSVRGKEHDVLHIRYIGCSRVFLYQFRNMPLEKGSVDAALIQVGFRRLECDDGYEESWSVDYR